MDTLAFAIFGLACLALYAGAKSLDDRDRDRDESGSHPVGAASRAQDQTISFASGERLSRTSDRPADRDSWPAPRPKPKG